MNYIFLKLTTTKFYLTFPISIFFKMAQNYIEQPPTEITTKKVVIDKIIISSPVTSCHDQKIWCKHADCNLDNVKRSCQKTCGLCN